MKNLTKLLGIIALAAVIGFGTVGCESPTGSTTGKTLTDITLNTASVKKAYVQNETLNLSGLVVTANYSDGSKAEVTDYTADPANGATLSATETTTVTVSYTEGVVTKTADFSITVTVTLTSKTLADITLNTDSVKKAYIQNETLDLSGLVVTATYSDDSSVAVTDYTADPASGATLSTTGSTTVTVSYTEGTITKTADFTVTVKPTLTDITAEYTGTTHHVYTFTLLNSLKDHLTVTAQYSDDSSATLEAEDYELTGTLTVGTSTITASYTEGSVTKTDTFDVTVTDATLDSIEVDFDQDDETIYTSTPLDDLKQYLTVTATYTFPGSQETLEETLEADEYELSGELTDDPPTITVNYGGKTETFTPTVTAVALVSITAVYNGGDVEINSNVDDLKDDLTVTAHYNDGSTPTVSEYTLNSDSPFTAIGSKTITVTYGGKTTTFTVTVVCTNHDWSNWTKTKNATVTEDGEETETCSICGITGTTTRFSGEYATGTAGLSFTVSIDGGTNNAYRVSRGTASGAIVIPAYYRPNASSPYLPVTQIGNGNNSTSSNAFGGTSSSPDTTVTSITFAEGSQLTAIEPYAFYQCTSLTSITIPATVDLIHEGAFQGCTSLVSITIPPSVTGIGGRAFTDCTSLASITIPPSIITSIGIGGYAFNNWQNTQIIYVEGYDSETDADTVWRNWIGLWRDGCNAVRKYLQNDGTWKDSDGNVTTGP
jgi:hypothetical protein